MVIRKLNPREPIPKLNGFTAGDFWSWAYSDTLGNRNRAIFAEFLVGAALDVLDEPRIEWNGYDLLYSGKKIEVKASGFLQSWKQTGHSKITFDIAHKNAWDSATNTFANNVQRSADCYVFCLYAETDLAQANVFNIDAWEFYVITTAEINEVFGYQKSIALTRLRQICQPRNYDELRPTIDSLLFKNSIDK